MGVEGCAGAGVVIAWGCAKWDPVKIGQLLWRNRGVGCNSVFVQTLYLHTYSSLCLPLWFCVCMCKSQLLLFSKHLRRQQQSSAGWSRWVLTQMWMEDQHYKLMCADSPSHYYALNNESEMVCACTHANSERQAYHF